MQTVSTIADILTGSMAMGKPAALEVRDHSISAEQIAAAQSDFAPNADPDAKPAEKFEDVLTKKLQPTEKPDQTNPDPKKTESKNITDKTKTAENCKTKENTETAEGFAALESAIELLEKITTKLTDSSAPDEKIDNLRQTLEKLAESLQKLTAENKDLSKNNPAAIKELSETLTTEVKDLLTHLKTTAETDKTQSLLDNIETLGKLLKQATTEENPLAQNLTAEEKSALADAAQSEPSHQTDKAQDILDKALAEAARQQDSSPSEKQTLPADKGLPITEIKDTKDPELSSKVHLEPDKTQAEKSENTENNRSKSAQNFAKKFEKLPEVTETSPKTTENDPQNLLKLAISSPNPEKIDIKTDSTPDFQPMPTTTETDPNIPQTTQKAPQTTNFSPELTKNITSQLQESINSSIAQGKREIQIRLNPPELGKVSIKLNENSNQLSGMLEVDRAQTRYEIERALPEIIRNMNQAGVQIKRIEVVLSERGMAEQQQSFREHFAQGQNPFQDHTSGQRSGFGYTEPIEDSLNPMPSTAAEPSHWHYAAGGLNMLV